MNSLREAYLRLDWNVGVTLLSIAIPTWNRAIFLEECLRGFITEIEACDEPVEIIVVDNASTDNTADVVAMLATQHSYIRRVYNNVNIGPTFNILGAFLHATSDYVWMMGDDDLPIPGSLHTVLTALRSISNLGCIYLNFVITEADSRQVVEARYLKQTENEFYEDGREFAIKMHAALIGLCALVLKRQCVSDFLSPRYAEEGMAPLILALQALTCGGGLLIAEPQVIQRIGDRSSWDSFWRTYWLYNLPRCLGRAVNQLDYDGRLVDAYVRSSAWKLVRNVRHWREAADRLEREGADVRSLAPFYGRIWYFWPLVVPQLIIPRPLWPLVKRVGGPLYRRYSRLRRYGVLRNLGRVKS